MSWKTKLAKELGLRFIGEELGHGSYGVAYLTSRKSVVLKITSDRREVLAAQNIMRLRKRKGFVLPSLVRIYGIYKLNRRNLWVILREKVNIGKYPWRCQGLNASSPEHFVQTVSELEKAKLELVDCASHNVGRAIIPLGSRKARSYVFFDFQLYGKEKIRKLPELKTIVKFVDLRLF